MHKVRVGFKHELSAEHRWRRAAASGARGGSGVRLLVAANPALLGGGRGRPAGPPGDPLLLALRLEELLVGHGTQVGRASAGAASRARMRRWRP